MKSTNVPVTNENSKLRVEYPARREPAGTVEIPVALNGREYFCYMIPCSCVARSFNGLNNITNKGAHPSEILAAITLSGIGGSIMMFTDAYAGGKDLRTLDEYIKSQKILVDGGVQLTMTPTGGSGYAGKNFGGMLVYNGTALKAWYDATFGAAENDGWNNHMRVNMDALFYQVGGRPHAKRDSDKAAHEKLDASLEAARAKLAAKRA
jgi:hypothetical protein